MKALAALIVLVLAGCSNLAGGSLTQPCMAAFTGALAGSLDGCLVLTTADPAGTWTITVGGTPNGTVKALASAAGTLQGAPRSVRADLSGQEIVEADYRVRAVDGSSYHAGKAPADMAPPLDGAVQLDIRAVVSVNGVYTVSGSLNVTMESTNAGKPGKVYLAATF